MEGGKLAPLVACKDKKRRIELLDELTEFYGKYRAALKRYTGGDKKVLFPEGTYWMRVHFGVACEGAPAPA